MQDQNFGEDIKKFMDKVKSIEKNEKLDLSSGEDLSIGIMNLVSIEEHLFFSGAKTGKTEYYEILKEVREMRKELMKDLIKDYEGEVWCLSKHLLASSMRLLEVGTKYQGKGDNKKAEDLFSKSYKLYSLFWGLNLGLVKLPETVKDGSMEETKAEEIRFVDDKKTEPSSEDAEKTPVTGMFEKLGKIVQKAIDCCKE